ncbi:mechanosensitive ion channel family protein [Sporolactobacillus pectinivorans]|uniref:mechanosensitive ion channel family protein n=1 Tax=Sporolactobacillus pectinivorans TaxID=1591408 RepID=UPI000C265FB3
MTVGQFEWLTRMTWTDGAVAAGIFIIFLFARILFAKYFPKLIASMTKLSKSQIDDALITAFRRPIGFILIATGIYLALAYLPIPHQWKDVVSLFYTSAATFSIGWGFYLFSDAIGVFFNHMGDRFDLQFNNIIIPFLSKLAKFIVAILTIVLILDQWNYHVTGLITGLGIGGLAFAMAAKDTLSNLFGGFVIITDAPFTIGELIHTGSIEGVVEDINFRSTRIRTADQALVTVPNSTLATQPITNLSRMNKRRVSFRIPIDLDTSNKQLTQCVTRIRKLLTDDQEVYEEGMMVYLDEITASSINLMIQFFVRTTDFEEWLKLKEKFNFSILSLLDDEDIELATTRPQMVFDASKQAVSTQLPVAEEETSVKKTRDQHQTRSRN